MNRSDILSSLVSPMSPEDREEKIRQLREKHPREKILTAIYSSPEAAPTLDLGRRNEILYKLRNEVGSWSHFNIGCNVSHHYCGTEMRSTNDNHQIVEQQGEYSDA